MDFNKNNIIATVIIFSGCIITSWITQRNDIIEKLITACGLSIGYFFADSVKHKNKKNK